MTTAASSRRLLQRVHCRLLDQYGPRPWQSHGPALDVLIGTILSQSTSRANNRTAYRRLRERFATWDDVADAPVGRIEACIRPGGLSRQKAPRLRAVLRRLRAERGEIDLQFLGGLTPAAAMDYLLSFDGVGVKTACCVLMFSFGLPVFPVDTHILRLAIRLGVLAEGATAVQAHAELPKLIGQRDRYAMHLLLIAHGRAVCRARTPRCEDCCLLTLCPFGRRRLAAAWA